MSDMDRQMQELRENYRRDLPPRFAALEQQLEQLVNEGFPQASFQEFLRLIHNLSGSSGLFGLTGVQNVAQAMEQRITPLVEAGQQPSEEEVNAFRRGLAALRQSG